MIIGQLCQTLGKRDETRKPSFWKYKLLCWICETENARNVFIFTAYIFENWTINHFFVKIKKKSPAKLELERLRVTNFIYIIDWKLHQIRVLYQFSLLNLFLRKKYLRMRCFQLISRHKFSRKSGKFLLVKISDPKVYILKSISFIFQTFSFRGNLSSY